MQCCIITLSLLDNSKRSHYLLKAYPFSATIIQLQRLKLACSLIGLFGMEFKLTALHALYTAYFLMLLLFQQWIYLFWMFLKEVS